MSRLLPGLSLFAWLVLSGLLGDLTRVWESDAGRRGYIAATVVGLLVVGRVCSAPERRAR